MVTARQLPLHDDIGRLPIPRSLRPASEPEPDDGGSRVAVKDRRRLVQLVLLPRLDFGEKPPLPVESHRPRRVDVSAGPCAGVAEVALFRQRVALASIDPTRNRARFYLLAWQPGLWGGGALIRTWGRLGAPGQSLTARYDDREAAQARITELLRRRLRHGYLVIDWE